MDAGRLGALRISSTFQAPQIIIRRVCSSKTCLEMESSIGDLVASGVKLMLIGMSIVFSFLALLVGIISVSAKLFNRYSPEAPTHLSQPGAAHGSAASVETDGDLLAAITAAIRRYQDKS